MTMIIILSDELMFQIMIIKCRSTGPRIQTSAQLVCRTLQLETMISGCPLSQVRMMMITMQITMMIMLTLLMIARMLLMMKHGLAGE